MLQIKIVTSETNKKILQVGTKDNKETEITSLEVE